MALAGTWHGRAAITGCGTVRANVSVRFWSIHMDQALAPSLAPSPNIVFRDGLGERRRVTDPTGRESVDLWYVSSELPSAALEAALRDRVKRLTSFEHTSVNHVHSVDRVNNGATLAVISDSAVGVRLADLLTSAEKHHLSLDISAALCVI